MLIADLSILSGKQQGKFIRLPNGRFLIGRGEDCQLRPNSDLVSRHHCAFNFDGIALRIKDLGSTNGTFVNGEQIRSTKILQPGDKVIIGKLEFEVVIKDVPAESKITLQNPDVIEGNTDSEIPVTNESETVTMNLQQYGEQEQFSETQVIQSAETMITMPPAQPGYAPQPNFQPMGHEQGYQTNPYAQPNPYAQQGMPMGMPGYPQPMPPQMPPQMPMGYPGGFGGYPQPQYPYGQYPMPMQQPVYQQAPYQPQMPQAPAPAPAPAPVAEEPASEDKSKSKNAITVKLPDPKETGLKAPPAPPAGSPSGTSSAPAASPEEKPSKLAADILRNMVVRKPGG